MNQHQQNFLGGAGFNGAFAGNSPSPFGLAPAWAGDAAHYAREQARQQEYHQAQLTPQASITVPYDQQRGDSGRGDAYHQSERGGQFWPQGANPAGIFDAQQSALQQVQLQIQQSLQALLRAQQQLQQCLQQTGPRPYATPPGPLSPYDAGSHAQMQQHAAQQQQALHEAARQLQQRQAQHGI